MGTQNSAKSLPFFPLASPSEVSGTSHVHRHLDVVVFVVVVERERDWLGVL